MELKHYPMAKKRSFLIFSLRLGLLLPTGFILPDRLLSLPYAGFEMIGSLQVNENIKGKRERSFNPAS